MKSKYFGQMARILRSIPVTRPQDEAVSGRGRVSVIDTKLRGHEGTKFTKDLSVGDTIMILLEDNKTKLVSRVVKILDDTQAELKTAPVVHDPKGELRVVNNSNMPKSPSLLNLLAASKKHAPTSFDVPQPRKYKIIPKLDQSIVFQHVIDQLSQGGVVGIFPEGGSHDNPHLLPLKAGITIMAFETMMRNPDMRIPIIPVGINYFNGHRFRSRVYVETGDAIYPSQELLKQYKRGGEHKRAACVALLEQIRTGLKDVIVSTPDRSSYEFIQTVRRLYIQSNNELDARARHAVNKAFADKLPTVNDDPRVQKLYSRVVKYRKRLKELGITDSRVAHAKKEKDVIQRAVLLGMVFKRCLLLFVYVLASVPALILATPVVILTRYISTQKARAAVRKSSVKLTGRDVVATWKLMVALIVIPLLHIIYTVIACFMGGEKVGVVYFYFAPFVSLAGIRCFESGIRIQMSIKSLLLSLRSGKSRGVALVQMRKDLQAEVRSVTTALGWDRKLAITQPELFRSFTPTSSPRGRTSSGGFPRNESYGNFF